MKAISPLYLLFVVMLKIGHRGAMAHATENTLASFKKALEFDIDMVELDVRITKDKHPVVVHDRTLRRVAKEYLRVNRLTLQQLKKVKLQDDESIPTLAEVLEVLDSKVGFNIDLKVRGSAQAVIQTLRDYKIDLDKVMISSVHPSELREAETLEPEVTKALIFRSANASKFWLTMDALAILFLPITQYYIAWLVHHANADYLNINYRFLSRKKMELFKKRGIKICAWTVDSKRKIAHLKNMGVDGIISNYPDRL